MSVNVLIIEDDVDLNDLLTSHLTLAKFGCKQAFTGEEGLKLAGHLHPDVVLLDLMMPGIDGYEVCRRLKASRATCDIPVLLLSCMCRDEKSIEGWRAGAWGQMCKPFEPRKVARQIEEAAQWRQQVVQRPPNGEITIGGGQLEKTARSVAEMLCVVVSRTAADDTAVGEIRDGFADLQVKATSSPIQVLYAVEPASPLGGSKPTGGALRFTIIPPTADADAVSTHGDTEFDWLKRFSEKCRLTNMNNSSPVGNRAGYQLERRFSAGGMIGPKDGNVLPITAQVKTNTPH